MAELHCQARFLLLCCAGQLEGFLLYWKVLYSPDRTTKPRANIMPGLHPSTKSLQNDQVKSSFFRCKKNLI